MILVELSTMQMWAIQLHSLNAGLDPTNHFLKLFSSELFALIKSFLKPWSLEVVKIQSQFLTNDKYNNEKYFVWCIRVRGTNNTHVIYTYKTRCFPLFKKTWPQTP